MPQKIQIKLIILILLLIVLTSVTTWLFLLPDYLLGMLLLIVLVINVKFIISTYSIHIKKIAFMFNAVENDDYTFNFSTEKGLEADKMLNQSLNRIKYLIEQTRVNIQQHEKFYELIMNSVKTGIAVINDSGSVHQHNKELEKLLNLTIFTHIKQLGQLNESLPDKLLKLQVGEKLHVSVSNERGTMILSIHASEMILNDKRLRIFSFNDINSELDEREIEAWVRLIRVLTHEIMNSITPITSLSDSLIEQHGDKDPEIRRGLEIISTTGKGLVMFVDSYRKLTRMPTPTMKPFEVYGFLTNLIELSRHDAPHITIKLEIVPLDLMIYGDYNLLSQVVINLLKNACQAVYEADKTEILVKAYTNADEAVMIEVCDTGCGISDEIAQHIFIPFFSTKENGSGIGLSIARQIMRLHNGSILLKRNVSPYTTVFRLTFN